MSNAIAKRKTCEEFHACTIDSDTKTNCTEYENRDRESKKALKIDLTANVYRFLFRKNKF